MRRGPVFILLGLIILVGGAAAFLFLNGGNPFAQQVAQQPTVEGDATQPPSEPVGTPLPTATPIELVNIVIAVQELPRGFRIPENAIAVRPFPAESAPFNVVTDPAQVIGRIARTDIFREQPILSNMVVEDFQALANTLGRVGSDAAAVLPNNLVAIAMPIDRLTSVAYAVQDGDRVDVLVSMMFVDVDEGFQSIAPNLITLYTVLEDGSIVLLSPVQGRPDVTSLGRAIIGPSERQRPRLTVQRTVQDALVVHVGDFPLDGRFIGIPPTPTPVPEDVQEVDPNEEVPPTPTPAPPDIITLGVTPQDAVLLVWAMESRLPLTLALRSAADTSRVNTQAVTMDYFMREFRIVPPAKFDYTLEPALRSIRQLVVGEEISLIGSGGGQ